MRILDAPWDPLELGRCGLSQFSPLAQPHVRCVPRRRGATPVPSSLSCQRAGIRRVAHGGAARYFSVLIVSGC